MADLDTAALKENFAAVASHGVDTVALFFYSYLFVGNPETRRMFAPAMTRQRDRLVTALGYIVSHVDQVDDLVPFLQDLGRDHRKFGTEAAHYPAVGRALVATLRHFSGDAWTEELEAGWVTAYGIVAETMSASADAAAENEPAWWDAEIVAVDRRTFDIAVVTVRTAEPVPYRAGQAVSVEASDLRPREWRWYSPATRPHGRQFDLHVRLLAGGPVSSALVHSARVGSRLRLGPPVGRMVLDEDSDRPVLLVAGGTGLAPLKAVVDQIAADGGRPTQLYFGVRTVREIYDGPALERLAAAYDWLTVVIAVSEDDSYDGPHGLISDIAVNDGDWSGHDVFVCGSPQMVEATVKAFVAHGVPEDQIRFDEFGQS